MSKHKKILIALVCLVLGSPLILAQQTSFYLDPDNDLKDGIDLFAKEKYGAAQDRFARYINRTEGEEATSRADAIYYDALCALRLDQNNAETKIENFLEAFPENAKANEARFEMGRTLFKEKKYKRVMRWFKQLDIRRLTPDERAEYSFRMGYCYFDQEDYKEAGNLFREVIGNAGPFDSEANYYYAYIQYLNKNYETALTHFQNLKDHRHYKGVVPYYIAQIYYLQEKYAEVVDFAPELLRTANEDQRSEISRIIGDAHFRLKQYRESIPYLEQYRRTVRTMSREEHYQLGFAYYKNDQLNEAVAELERVKDGEDPLSQNSNHLLGGILITLDDKYKARNAFRKAANLEFSKLIQEESLLNYAKLSFDLSISGETLRAFEEFLSLFPESEYTDQVYDYLVKVLMNTRNYREALITLDKIENKNSDMQAAYQRIAYYRGLELFNNLKFQDAIDHFNKSLNFSWFDAEIKALCQYWSGEAWYRLESYDLAIKAFDRFLLSNRSYDLPEYNLAHYNLGYAYFQKQNYTEASTWFRKFVNRVDDKQPKLKADAYNRIADCLFVNRSYWQAIEQYDRAATYRTEDADYAMFQKGFSLGLVQRPNKKIEVLNELISKYPKSRYADDALYEIAKSYIDLSKKDAAISHFRNLIRQYSQSSYVRKAYLQLGLIYYNSEQNSQALEMYKKVVSSWPETSEARDALAGIKNIFVDENRVEEYFSYVKSTGQGTDVSILEQDSLSYIAAENVFMQGDCDRAKDYFNRYIERFANGQFLLNAHYYKADCNFKAAEYDKALTSYEWILSRGNNDFSELALSRTGAIYYHEGNYTRALDIYSQLAKTAEIRSNMLDARLGILRCTFIQKDYAKAIVAANEVLYTDKISDEVIREATYKLGKSYLETGDVDGAFDVLTVVANDVKNIEGAEAKYLCAYIMYGKGQVDEAEKEVLDFIDKNTTHQYWLAKAYILWSDIYRSKKDYFQAKATLQILLENYSNKQDDILKIVREKIEEIDNLENN